MPPKSKEGAKPKGGNPCCVWGCNYVYQASSKRELYRFPVKKSPQRTQLWIDAMPQSSQGWRPSPYSFICSAHFHNGKKDDMLHLPGFVPSIFPPIPERQRRRHLKPHKPEEIENPGQKHQRLTETQNTVVKQGESFANMESTEHMIKEEILEETPDGQHTIKLEIDQGDYGASTAGDFTYSSPVGLIIKTEPTDSFNLNDPQPNYSGDPTDTGETNNSDAVKKFNCALCCVKCESRRDLFNHRKLEHYKAALKQINARRRKTFALDSKNWTLGKDSYIRKLISRSMRPFKFSKFMRKRYMLERKNKNQILRIKLEPESIDQFQFSGTEFTPSTSTTGLTVKKEKKLKAQRKYKRRSTGLFKCTKPNCSAKTFYTKWALYGHVKKAHPGLPYVIYTCPHCMEYFDTKEERKEHKKVCEKCKSRYECENCGKKFGLMKELKNHVEGVHLYSPVKCTVCDKPCKNKKRLATHMWKMHGKNRSSGKWGCLDCGKLCKDKHELETHRRQHTGISPFVCNICNKTFKQKSNLNTHKYIHTDAHPFFCMLCFDTKFKYRGMLLKHIRRLHRGLPEETIQDMARQGEIKNEPAPLKVEPGDNSGENLDALNNPRMWNDVNTAKYSNPSLVKSETPIINKMGPTVDSESLLSESGQLYGYFQSRISKDNTDCAEEGKDDGEIQRIKREKEYARNWKCALCPLDYISKRLLINHVKLHINGRGLECPYCSALLPRTCDRNRHIRTYHSHLANQDTLL